MSAFDELMNRKAVALAYSGREQEAPVVVASGTGYMAQRIIDAARDSHVPVYEDNSLATVLTQLELGSPIPEELYTAIVDIYLYFLHYGKRREESEPEQEASADV